MELTKLQKEDLRVIGTPFSWPAWPYMPMKKHSGHGFPTCGTLIACIGGENKVVVDEGDILWTDKCHGKTFDEIYKMYPVKEYKNIEEMLADGWECD